MTVNVVRTDCWIDGVFDDVLLKQENVHLDVLRREDAAGENLAKLAAADIYHVSAARDELPVAWRVTDELLARCPRLRVVSSSGAGYDTIDLDACTSRGVLVVNQSGGNAASVAEHTLGLMLALSHRIVESNVALCSGKRTSREAFMGHELSGLRLGLIGIGSIGRRVATLGHAFGMRVAATDPYLDRTEIESRGAASLSFNELLETSDIVSVHCPRTEETVGMFCGEQFRRMKEGAVFVSTARGGIHLEDALYDAIVDGHLRGAGLDVWAKEPPSADNKLLKLPNVVATYHIAGVTHEARRNMAKISAMQIAGVCNGEMPNRVLNASVLNDFRFPPTVVPALGPGR